MDRKETARLLEIAGEVWPREITENTITAYQLALSDLTLAQVEVALAACMRAERFFPAPATLRQRIPHADGVVLPDASATLAELHRAIAFWGYAGVPVWSSAALEHTVQALGGWLAVCQWPLDQTGTLHAQFRTAYGECCTTLRRDWPPAALQDDLRRRRALQQQRGFTSAAAPASAAPLPELPPPDPATLRDRSAELAALYAQFLGDHQVGAGHER